MKLLKISLLVAVAGILPAEAGVITGFGSSEFAIDGGNTDFSSTIQTGTTTNAQGTDTNILVGTFSSVNIDGFSSIELTALVTGTNPNSAFTVDLFDSSFNYNTYTGFLSSFSSSPSTVALTFSSQTGAFSGDVVAFQFTGAGAGSSLNITFDNLSAVPEPTTLALGALGLGALVFGTRRKRTSAIR